MTALGIVYDLIFAVILLVSALNGRRRGLVSGAVSLVGAVAGLVVAGWLANVLGSAIYNGVIGNAMADAINQALSDQGASLIAVLQDQLGFLPQQTLDQLAAVLQPLAETVGTDLQPRILEALQPIIQPMIIAVIFVVAFVLIRWAISLVAGALQLVNHIPLVGGVNQILGLVLGLATGAIDCWMLCLVLWAGSAVTAGSVEFLSQATLTASALYRFFAGFNPFV